MAFRMTEKEFEAFCAERGISVQNAPQKDSSKNPRPPKYRNRKVYVYNGVAVFQKDDRLGQLTAIYDSEKEYCRHNELILAEKAGLIHDLKRQVNFLIQEPCERHGKKIQAISYKADFCYQRDGQRVVEDVKAFDKKTQKHITTKDFVLKWKLLQYRYPDILFELY